jgi:hypothetical protein
MAHTVELLGGPFDGSIVVVQETSTQYMVVANNTDLNSIRVHEKALPDLQVGFYEPPNPLPKVPPERERWYWIGYRKQEDNE